MIITLYKIHNVMMGQRKFVRFIIIGSAADYYSIIWRELIFLADSMSSLVVDPGLKMIKKS